ncbi:IS3 family transposase [Flintibacter sp.]|uniref:IS3 family transposase n=1 Tax=Flintibacter sp. TaxID=1918624 RepID=UPI003A4AE993
MRCAGGCKRNLLQPHLLQSRSKQVFDDSEQRFGAEKIRIVLADSGIYVSKKRILAIMQKMGLSSVRVDAKNQFKRKQQYEKQNLLKREFSAGHPNQIWVSDITYLKSKATGSISASSWIYTYAKSSGGGYPET